MTAFQHLPTASVDTQSLLPYDEDSYNQQSISPNDMANKGTSIEASQAKLDHIPSREVPPAYTKWQAEYEQRVAVLRAEYCPQGMVEHDQVSVCALHLVDRSRLWEKWKPR